MNKERLVFEVTDEVKTPEEITPWEGELMSPATKSSLSSNFEALEFFKLEFCLGGSILAFIGCETFERLEYFFSSANPSGLGIESELGRTHPNLYWV